MRRDRMHEGNPRPGEEAAGLDATPETGGTQPEEPANAPAAEADAGSRESGAPAGEGAARDDVRSEADELRDRYLRLAAEFDNYRKRTDRERSDQTARAQGTLVQSLLDAIDDLERVADYTTETTTVAALLEGVQMVERKLLRALETAGLERVEAQGATFDPSHHEALMTSSTEHPHEDDTVGEVFQHGYRFQGHLLRPARVQVRKHPG